MDSQELTGLPDADRLNDALGMGNHAAEQPRHERSLTMPAGLPPRMEYEAGEMIPFPQDQRSMALALTRWRCLQCGDTVEFRLGRDAMFGNCYKCGSGRRWGFVDARQP